MSSDKPLVAPENKALVASKGNPQGKGLIGFLLDWDYSSPRGVVAKRAPQLMADYFTSLLVLSAAFKFKPVFGKEYYLYTEDQGWSLSLISPDEWNNDQRRMSFVGKCMLHNDSTWSIEPSSNIGKRGPVDDALAAFYKGFVEKLKSRRPLEDDLPTYEADLPYYQRIFAAALSRSLKGSLFVGDRLGVSAYEWLKSMPKEADQLLLAASRSE
jgi:hypothetical protein